MRILFQCPKYLPSIGGIELNTHYTAKELIKQGHKVSVLCESFSFNATEENLEGVKVYRYPKPNFNKLFRPFSAWIQQKNIKKYCSEFFEKHYFDLIISEFFIFVKPTKELVPDIPLIFLQPSIAYIAFRKMAKHSVTFKDKKDNYLKSLIAFFEEKKAIRFADIIWARSPVMNNINQDIFHAPIEKRGIFSQGIATEKFRIRKSPLKNTEKFKGKKIVLTISRFTPDKNNSTLIKVFSKIKTKNSLLVLVADGPEREYLEELTEELNLKDRVIFLGEKKDIENYYGLGDVFVLASEQEGYPNVFSEAMASGIPIIGFKSAIPKITIPTEYIVKSGGGFAVKNEEEMAEKIDLLLNNNNLREKMGKEARKNAESHSWKKCADEIISICKKIKKPKVSVVIPLYNSEKYIAETLNSVKSQTLKDIEIIIVNDCSTDNSLKEVEKFAKKDKRIKIISLSRNSGAAASINAGVKNAFGEYISIFDSDDIMAKDKLKVQAEFLDENQEIDAVYSDMIILHPDKNKVKRGGPDFNDLEQPYGILKKSSERKDIGDIEPYLFLIGEGIKKSIPSRSLMFRRRIFENLKCDEKLRNAEDYDFLFQVIGAGFKLKHLPFESFIYRRHENQKSRSPESSSNRKRAYFRINKKLKNQEYFKRI